MPGLINEVMKGAKTAVKFIPLEIAPEFKDITQQIVDDAVSLTCYINADDFEIGVGDSETIEVSTLCDEVPMKLMGMRSFDGSINFLRQDYEAEGKLAPGTTGYDVAYQLFRLGDIKGWLITRLGLKHNVPFTAENHISIYKVISDIPKDKFSYGQEIAGMIVKFSSDGGGIFINDTLAEHQKRNNTEAPVPEPVPEPEPTPEPTP